MKTSLAMPYAFCCVSSFACGSLVAQVERMNSSAGMCLSSSFPVGKVDSAIFRLVGSYSLTVIIDRGGGQDTLAKGYLTLKANPDSALGDTDPSFPLWGWADIDLRRLGALSFAYSPSSRRPERPGVQLLHHKSDGSLTLVLGNAFTRAGVAEDRGVYFQVLEIVNNQMRGRWRDGGRGTVKPSGYFCAGRLAQDSSASRR